MNGYERSFYFVMIVLFTLAWAAAVVVYPSLISMHSLVSIAAPIVAAVIFIVLRDCDPKDVADWELALSVIFIVGCIVFTVLTIDGRTTVLAVLLFLSFWLFCSYWRAAGRYHTGTSRRRRKQRQSDAGVEIFETPEPEPAA